MNALQNLVIVVEEAQQTGNRSETQQELQKRLQNVSNRWMAICQFAEKRWQRLQTLKEKLKFIGAEQSQFSDWLDQREAALSTLKSVHHLHSTKEVLSQVENLDVRIFFIGFYFRIFLNAIYEFIIF